jgi:hypothetical protein
MAPLLFSLLLQYMPSMSPQSEVTWSWIATSVAEEQIVRFTF